MTAADVKIVFEIEEEEENGWIAVTEQEQVGKGKVEGIRSRQGWIFPAMPMQCAKVARF